MGASQAHHGLYFTHIDNDVVRIYNMLAMHGIIICSASGALAIQKAVLEGYERKIIWDIFVAQIQPYYNVYALKQPLVFQDKKYNSGSAEEEATRFSITLIGDNPLPDIFKNTTNVSIITCCKSRRVL
jgi:hypothetical protein